MALLGQRPVAAAAGRLGRCRQRPLAGQRAGARQTLHRLRQIKVRSGDGRRAAPEPQPPLRWRRDEQNPQFNGELQLAADKVSFSDGGHLPAPVLALQLNGRSPDNFQLQGKLQAQQIGPIALRGRWDGERLRGEGWWPKQSLKVFQLLLAPDLNFTLRDGEFYAQSAFSLPASRASKPAATGW